MKTSNELLSSVHELICPILTEAGKIMLGATDIDGEGGVSEKPGTANFVTLYDIRVQKYLMKELSARFEDAYFIAEEKENDAESLRHPCCFVIDPIDGTTNFIHSYNHSCISLALLSYGEVIYGAVYDPYLGELFHAEKGKGAYLNGKPIKVSQHPMNYALTAFGTAPYCKDTLLEKTFALVSELCRDTADIRRCGSAALDMAYLAAGRNDIFFEFMLSPWDIAAGSLLITEAGGVITDMKGNPISFAEPGSILAATENLHGEVLERTKKYF